MKISVSSRFNVNALEWSFINVAGSPVHVSYHIEDNELQIDAAQLSKGIYLIKVIDGFQVVTKKLIVR